MGNVEHLGTIRVARHQARVHHDRQALIGIPERLEGVLLGWAVARPVAQSVLHLRLMELVDTIDGPRRDPEQTREDALTERSADQVPFEAGMLCAGGCAQFAPLAETIWGRPGPHVGPGRTWRRSPGVAPVEGVEPCRGGRRREPEREWDRGSVTRGQRHLMRRERDRTGRSRWLEGRRIGRCHLRMRHRHRQA